MRQTININNKSLQEKENTLDFLQILNRESLLTKNNLKNLPDSYEPELPI